MREQLKANEALETQRERFLAELEHLVASLGVVRAQLVRMSIAEEGEVQQQVTGELRDLRSRMGDARAGHAGGLRGAPRRRHDGAARDRIPVVKLAHAQEIVAHVVANAPGPVSVFVADAHGELVAAARMDGSNHDTRFNAQRKAFTVARSGVSSTLALGEGTADDPQERRNFDPAYTFWPGGVAIYDGDALDRRGRRQRARGRGRRRARPGRRRGRRPLHEVGAEGRRNGPPRQRPAPYGALMRAWTRRRVETPASRLSPGLRARTKMTSAPPLRSGRSGFGRIEIVAQPVESVGDLRGRVRVVVRQPEGVDERALDREPARVHDVELGRERVVRPDRVRRERDLVTTRRFGRLTWATAIALPPVFAAEGAIRSVSAEVASVVPFAFFAATLTRIVLPTSAEVSA